MTESLFRPEALAHRSQHAPGRVILRQPRAFVVFSLLIAALILLVLALLFTQRYTRRVPSNGSLVPDKGLLRIMPMQAGQISQRLVHDGQQVNAGQALFIINSERQTSSGALGAANAQNLSERRQSLQTELSNLGELSRQQLGNMRQRIAELNKQLQQMGSEVASQRRRVALAEATLSRYQELALANFAPSLQVQQRTEELLDQQGRLAALERNCGELRSQIAGLRSELTALPLREASQRATLERSLASLAMERSESEARREIIVTAPGSGTVTAINAEPGQVVAADSPLATVIPSGAKLQAHFYAPSSAIGFVQPGQAVWLRYAAFPYQKFGQHAGTVIDVSRSVLRQSAAGEPLYRITVQPQQQSVTAYGRQEALLADMQVDADILVDQRRLIEWIFEPLMSIKGKW